MSRPHAFARNLCREPSVRRCDACGTGTSTCNHRLIDRDFSAWFALLSEAEREAPGEYWANAGAQHQDD